ncbi:MAG TPA: ATP-binding cassette domain-containing protein [Bacteroidota bacterium]|nr:ATP-binding cassette domain-containing protein [Bacteroidota bacterium]
MNAVDLQHVSLSFADHAILTNIGLSVEQGTTSVILGPSGAGKSSVLKIILGLWRPTAGNVFINGTDTTACTEEELLPFRRKMAMVFQSNALFDSMTVAENIAFFLREHRMLNRQEIRERIRESLAFVNLEGTERLYPEELSGGMKKRVAIARAIAFHPDIILYDEPTTGLDPINGNAVVDLILRLQQRGTTSIIVTHHLKNAFSVGNSFSIIIDGVIAAAGTANDILASSDPFVVEFLDDIHEHKPFTIH